MATRYSMVALMQLPLPFSPSDLPWWGWLIVAVPPFMISVVTKIIAEESDNRVVAFSCGLIALATGLLAIFSSAIGIMRFFGWTWHTYL